MPFQFLLQGYSTLPGYGNRNGKEAVRPITIWKGNSYATISARDPAFSGKDSGKGDSDFNDSDSDVSGDAGLKKDAASAPPMGGPNGKKQREKGSRSPPLSSSSPSDSASRERKQNQRQHRIETRDIRSTPFTLMN